MGSHVDAINLPEGVERVPHAHDWKITRRETMPKEKGRPVCTVCGGMPSFFVLKEVDEDAADRFTAHGQYIRVEREPEPELPKAPESGDLSEHHADLREALKLPRKTDDELREFIDDFVSNRIFTSAHLRDHEVDMLTRIFLPLGLGCFSTVQPDSLAQVGVLYEEYSKAAPRSINGLPMFFSFKMLHIDDWKRAQVAIDKEMERRKTIEL